MGVTHQHPAGSGNSSKRPGEIKPSPAAKPRKPWHPLEVVRWTTNFFARKGIESPRLDAELLLAHVLGWSRIDLYARFETPMPADKLACLRELVRRRARREPVKYILGRVEFRSLSFVVDRRVMIPRPETELLVEEALKLTGELPDSQRLIVADIGTGCGNIAIALAKEVSASQVFACDISAGALEVARLNADKLGVAERITFLQGDLYCPLVARGLEGKIDLVVSNPPYVSKADYLRLQAEITEYEPPIALLAGADGLALVRRLVAGAAKVLKPGGRLVFEIGEGQGKKALEFFNPLADFILTRSISDYQGIARVVVAQRR